MKPQPFNLELWLHLGKPDCVWTRNIEKIYELHYHDNARKSGAVLSGLMGAHKILTIWFSDGSDVFTSPDMMYSMHDLMLRLEGEYKTSGIKKR